MTTRARRLAVCLLLLLGAGCGFRPTPTWRPKDRTAPVTCRVPPLERTPGMPALSWDSIIYVDTGLMLGAEVAIRAQPGRTWTVARASRPGQHDQVVAMGSIDETGRLVGLSPAVFRNARGIWANRPCAFGEEPIPGISDR